MTAPVTLTFRHLPRSGALESSARDVGRRLKKMHQKMTVCHIVLERQGGALGGTGPCLVKIHLSVPGAQIHAASASPEPYTEAREALRSAYENAKRQLENLKRMRA